MTTFLTVGRRALGLPLLTIAALAALAAVRAVIHDTTSWEEIQPLNLALVFVPLVVWVAVAVVWSSRPFRSLLATGLAYGVLLAVVHLVFWDANLAASGLPQPELGGNLEGVLPPEIEGLLFRVAAVVSSLVTGFVTGAAAGLVAWLLRKAIRGVPGARPLPSAD